MGEADEALPCRLTGSICFANRQTSGQCVIPSKSTPALRICAFLPPSGEGQPQAASSFASKTSRWRRSRRKEPAFITFFRRRLRIHLIHRYRGPPSPTGEGRVVRYSVTLLLAGHRGRRPLRLVRRSFLSISPFHPNGGGPAEPPVGKLNA